MPVVIGKYKFSDEWKKTGDSFDSHIKEVEDIYHDPIYNSTYGSIQIYRTATEQNIKDMGCANEYHLWFHFRDIKDAYVAMYGFHVFFPTFELARERADTFIIKLNKLKAFL